MRTEADNPLKEVIIWGSGIEGRSCYELLVEAGIKVRCFIDRRPPESGVCRGLPVLRPEEAIANGMDVDAVFLAFSSRKEGPRAHLAEARFINPVVDYVDSLSIEEMIRPRVRFCIHRCIKRDGGDDDRALLEIIAAHLIKKGPIAVYGAGSFTRYLFDRVPALRASVSLLIAGPHDDRSAGDGIEIVSPDALPEKIETIFLSSTRWREIERMKRILSELGRRFEIITMNDLETLAPPALIGNGYKDMVPNIYPKDIPDFKFEPGLDMILLDCPPRFLGLMPNGLGYVHNILKKMDIRFQTVDADIIFYHRYHADKILDGVDTVVTKEGYVMNPDPWAADQIEESWTRTECVEYFRPDIDELKRELIAARPKMVGFSLHDTNLPIARELADAIREHLPETLILAGGYDCTYYDVGPNLFPVFDYMVIGDAEPTLEPLMAALLRGERPKDIAGVVSRFDSPDRVWQASALNVALDTLGYPQYEWSNISFYRSFNGYLLTPLVLSRGCRWSLCTFCAERFPWRARSSQSMVGEIEFLYDRGCRLFHFNDSDLSGNPPLVAEVADEIKRRKLDVSMVGQLRVHKLHTREYFDRLKAGGFTNLRFGIDAWAAHTLRLHNKGYTVAMIDRTLEACHGAGINVTVNLVIGVPGETEEDIDETIENMLRNKAYFAAAENINTLILARGGMYWENPDKYKIHFRSDRFELFKNNPKCIPTDTWYSEDPYIDQDVRKARLNRIMTALSEAGVNISAYAKWKTDKLQELRVRASEASEEFLFAETALPC